MWCLQRALWRACGALVEQVSQDDSICQEKRHKGADTLSVHQRTANRVIIYVLFYACTTLIPPLPENYPNCMPLACYKAHHRYEMKFPFKPSLETKGPQQASSTQSLPKAPTLVVAVAQHSFM